ncbi:serine hydrolase [Sphingobium boeckii]|uniref:beta-lactamase n=1 Tax=Sphingobium boeckii TaxID=1082345 RepID=A0A7W9EGB1_9SPHN|nr:serine hydrolase [Sphingobium boeckii]MBB5686556.1 beta-lactamase class A [Sphingobium boeckii]
MALMALTGLAGCSSRVIPPARTQAPAHIPPPVRFAPVAQPRPAEAPRALNAVVQSLGAGFDGQVGIAIRRMDQPWTIQFDGYRKYPQQSVSKLWVAATLLDQVDRKKVAMSDPVVVKKEDLTVFHQPIRSLVGADGYATSVAGLFGRSMTASDNTANDSLLRTIGGPEAVRRFFAEKRIEEIRFGPGERLLQSRIAGIEWKQEYSQGNAFYTARANLPMDKRQKALEAYLADPIDGATPVGIVNALVKLQRGDLLSRSSTLQLVAIMRASKTGPQRLRGGLSPGWTFGHKTGTGQELQGRATGFNDVGILTAPDGTDYAVAVMIGATRKSIPERQSLMQAVTRAVIANHRP